MTLALATPKPAIDQFFSARACEYRNGILHDTAARKAMAKALYESGCLENLLPVVWADSAKGGYELSNAVTELVKHASEHLARTDGGYLAPMPPARKIATYTNIANHSIRQHLKGTH